jgi:hypothetical protein
MDIKKLTVGIGAKKEGDFCAVTALLIIFSNFFNIKTILLYI